MFLIRFAIIAILLLILPVQGAVALDQPVLEISIGEHLVPRIQLPPDGRSDTGISVGPRMLLLVDSNNRLTLEDVLMQVQGWQTIDKESPNFGFIDRAHWFRFDLYHSGSTAITQLMELPIPFLDDVRLYHFVDGKLQQSYEVGDLKPFMDRPVRHQNFVMPLSVAPGRNELLLRVQSAGTVEAPLTLWQPETFYSLTWDARLLQGVFAGVMGIMVLYNLFLYFSVRDASYLYYVGFVISFLFFQICLKGYGYAYFWPNSVHFNSFAIATFVGFSELFFALFSSHFLRLKQMFPIGHLILQALVIISAFVTLATFFAPYTITIRVTTGLVLPVCAVAMFSGYWVWLKGGEHARYFCLASTAIILGISILVLGKFGLVVLNFWTENAAQIAALMQVSLLSFALADRINREKQLRINAQAEVLIQEQMLLRSQEKLISTQEEANRNLEQKVTERTMELRNTLGQLEEANEKLHALSITDSLTGIHNRAYFSEQYSREYARAHRQQIPLSLMLCDIDFFKSINDNYGHLAGDHCLKEFAGILRQSISRSGDVLARYGGEEFVVLLVNTPLEAAVTMAENLRQKIAEADMVQGLQHIHLTASFGVASCIPKDPAHEGGLLQQADDALYQAKSDGRNCVRSRVLSNVSTS
ncbi:hypothetical protein BTA51_12850 [Hahella sp. CCB-MM4]|uniref:sensor domain-containing diguanylate cyclase n=1 Tax=Hahella sp. (strain CCB-MM4) TaxID=1926491 RepID=UPI000B9BC5B1|nr:diguanylate cyclase [Hahella sp. CCB-MM4]OZG72857.1 hypothetical protein BTA51_12850 [Hahella sp. CCB-MM4]